MSIQEISNIADTARHMPPLVDDSESAGQADTGIGPSIPASPGFLAEVREIFADTLLWSWTLKLFALGVVLLYLPVIAETGAVWIKQDAHAHGIFILPLACFLLWVLRDDIRGAARRPTAWGLLPLAVGIFLETASYLLRLKFFPMLSLLPVLAGGILLFRGHAMWKAVSFPVLFLAFAAPLPDAILMPASAHVQHASTTGAVITMRTLGYPLIQTGNRIDTPQVSVEVAEVCSGFKKLTAMVAFALLYGFLFTANPWMRALLVLSAYPISLIANVIRICALIAIGSAGGTHALEAAHDWAEIGVLVVAFVMFTLFGKALGCRTIRFQQLAG